MTTLTPTLAHDRPVSAIRAQVLQMLVLVAGLLVHAFNMFGFPLFLGDEGIYMAQAWSVLRQGSLAPYTYQYDHAPAGWLVIAAWNLFTGGFHTFGTAVDSGRVLMLLLHGISLLLVFRIVLHISQSLSAATVASLLFTLSPLSVTYGRMVLLQNIMLVWVLLAVLLVLRHNGMLWPLMASAFCFGLAAMTHEAAIFLLPALIFGIYTGVAHYHARFARSGWLFISISIMSLYVLFAALKKELFSVDLSSPLAGNGAEVNLIGTAIYQLTQSGGAPWNPSSDFARLLNERWLPADAWLIGLGVLSTLWSVVRGPNTRRMVGMIGLLSFASLLRGGRVLEFEVLIALPWLAINAGLLAGDIANALRTPLLAPIVAAAAVSLTGLSLYNHQDIFTLNLTAGQREALAWVQEHVPPDARLVIDDDIWVDLREAKGDKPDFLYAHSHWKAELDPGIHIDFFRDTWEKVDYVVLTPGLEKVFNANPDSFRAQIYRNSLPVARFGTGEAMVEIRKVAFSGVTALSAMDRTWEGFKQTYVREGQVRVGEDPVQATHQATAMLMAVWMDDRETFEQLWKWARLHLRDSRGLFYGQSNGEDVTGTGLTAADTDAAMALVLAANRWQVQSYADDARSTARAIWQHYVVYVNDKPYLTAGDWAIKEKHIIFSPAAFSPAAYHLFASVNPDGQWWYLLDTNYDLLARITNDTLGEARSSGLPPAYVGIDRTTGELIARPAGAPKQSNAFNLEAAEVYWRLALDYRLHDDGRAVSFLRSSKLLSDEWRRKGQLGSAYQHNGTPIGKGESFALYSAVLPKIMVDNEQFAHALYATKIVPHYNQGREYAVWGENGTFDEFRLAWLANALYGRALNDDWSNKAVAPSELRVFDDWRNDPSFRLPPTQPEL